MLVASSSWAVSSSTTDRTWSERSTLFSVKLPSVKAMTAMNGSLGATGPPAPGGLDGWGLLAGGLVRLVVRGDERAEVVQVGGRVVDLVALRVGAAVDVQLHAGGDH